MSEKGVRLTNFDLKAEWVEAEKKIADFFEIKIGFPILRLSRLRGNEDGPFVFFESYFHPRIGLTGEEDFSNPLYEILENDYHVSPTFSNERIKARLASIITSNTLIPAINDHPDKKWSDHYIWVRHEGANHQRVQVPSGKLTVHPGSYLGSGTGRPSC